MTENMFEDFEISKVKSQDKKERKEIILSVRITRTDFEWIKKRRISASKLFNYVLHKIMKKEK